MKAIITLGCACIAVVLAMASQSFGQSYKRSTSAQDVDVGGFMADPNGFGLLEEKVLSPDGTVRSAYIFRPGLRRIPTGMIPLPVAVDQHDLLMQEARNVADFGAGFGLTTTDDSPDPVAVFRFVPNVKLDICYDTGSPDAANLNPSKFPIDLSVGALDNGQFSMRQSTANLKTDVQLPALAGQVYLDLRAMPVDGVEFRQVFGRFGNWLAGDYYSSFTDSGTFPQSIVADANPAGAMPDPKATQLQYALLFDSGMLFSLAIEDPTIDDFKLLADDNKALRRMPDFVARARFQPLDAWASVQGALLVRQFVYEDKFRDEHGTTGVAFSSNARFKTYEDDNARLGVVCGKGVGSRIFGLSGDAIAAGRKNGELMALWNTGAYGSYQHYWSDYLWSNVAYGYASADLGANMANLTRLSQNGWVNLIWNNTSGKVAVGLEYQVGEREIGDGRTGLNHHVQLSLQIGAGYTPPVKTTSNTPAAAGGGQKTFDADGKETDIPYTSPASDRVYPRL